MMLDMELDALVHNFCEKKVKKKAALIDKNPRALKKAFRQLGKKGLLTLMVPEELYGKDCSKEGYFSALETIQSYSGALGFFQRQHQAAARFIVEGDNNQLKRDLLPLMAKGKESVGVSVAHLRFPANPKVIGKRKTEGFILSGEVSWVSGHRLFNKIVQGFFIPEENREGMAVIPFKKGRFLKISSKPYPTIALSSMRTVTVKFKDLVIEENQLVALRPITTYLNRSSALMIHFVNLSGVARGLMRELERLEKDEDLFRSLCTQYEACRKDFLARENEEIIPELYASMNKLATDLLHLAHFAYGTQGIIVPNPIERLSRELFLFSVLSLDQEISQLSLEKLIGI